MANILSAELLAAQDNVSRFPMVEIKAGQFADDIPLQGQRLNAETLDQDGAASVTHSSGRLVTAYTQSEFANDTNYPARSVKLVYTDPERVEFYYANVFSATGTGKLSDMSLAEMEDGKLALAYILLDSTNKYSLKVATFDYNGANVQQYTIRPTQTLALYSPSICRTAAGYLVTYIQEIAISATRGGTYTGTVDAMIYLKVVVDGTHTTAQFEWKKGAGEWSNSITMTGSAQTLTDGVMITFNVGTYWTGQQFWFMATAARSAVGYVLAQSLPLDGDTVVVGSKTYTWRTTLSVPAVPNEVKIDPLGKEISMENLRCAITAGSYEGTGEGVRYSAGTTASGEVTATREAGTSRLTVTAITPGVGGNSLILTVDGTRLTKIAFSGGAASSLGILYWTPGSKIYTTTATLPSGTWATPTEPTISGALASRKKLDTCLLRQTDGTIWLFFTYMTAGDTDASAVYNLLYTKSNDNGVTWTEAVALTSFATSTEITRRPVAVQKLATEIILAYDSVKTSLSKDKADPYWSDEAYQTIRSIHFNPANRKLYAVYGCAYIGTKALQGIVRIDVDTWEIDRYWNSNTVPSIPLFFRENHVFAAHGSGDMVAIAAQDHQIIILDGAASTIKHLSLEDNSNYGLYANVSGVPFAYSSHIEKICRVFIDPAITTLYFAFCLAPSKTHIISLNYAEQNPACTILYQISTPNYAANEKIRETLSYDDAFWIDKVNGVLFHATLGSYASSVDITYVGHLRVFLLDGSGLLKEYYYQDSMPTFPTFGIRSPVFVNGKIYCAQHEYTTDYGQVDKWGIVSVDITTDAIKWHIPSSIITGGAQDAAVGGLKETEPGVIVCVCSDGVALFDTNSETWTLINNTTTPGVFPSDLNGNYESGFLFDYDSNSELIFMGVHRSLSLNSTTFSGVVAFPATGKLEKTHYYDAIYSGGVWNFGAANPLVRGTHDYSNALAVDTHGLYAFWTRWNSAEGTQLYWDKEAGTIDLTPGLVRGQAIQQTRSIDGQPGKLTFTLDKGHLYDPHNQASLLSRYLRKGKKITLRWGEKVNGVDHWQEGISVYVLTGLKLTYKRGSYPMATITCEDRRTLWENMGITATTYYSGITPDAVLSGILQTYANIAQSDIELNAINAEDAVYHQWLDTTLKTVVEDITNRYGYCIDVSLADNTIRARRIAATNAVDHAYSSATNLLDFSPDDSYSNFTNRVIVTGEGRTPLDVETAEESIGSESGTLGFFCTRQVHRIYYSDDHQARATRPRLDITQNVSSIGFQMAGSMKQWISDVDPAGHWVEVTSEGPDLLPVLLAAIGLFVAGKSQPPATGMISEPAESKRGSWMKDAGLYIALQCLAAIGNYSFTIYACPIGQVTQTFQATADDTELQNELRGNIITTTIDDPLVYDVLQAQQVANRELWILQAQRRRVKFSKTAHLQDDAGDTIQLPHPYTGAAMKLFVTNLTRIMVIPSNGSGGDFSDSIEGWRL